MDFARLAMGFSILRSVGTVALLCILAAGSARAQAAAAPAPANVTWYDRLEQGLAVRNQTRKPAMVFFSNQVAKDCRRMNEEVFKSPDVSARLTNFVCFNLDAGAHQDLLNRYNVFKVPTVLFLDPAGKEVDRAVGFKPPQIFSQYLDRTNTASLAGATPAQGQQTQRVANIVPFKTATINVMQPHPNTKAVTLSFRPPATVKSLSLVGDFNDWRGDAAPMQRATNGDAFVTVYLPEGVYEYMFLDSDNGYHADARNPFGRPNPYGGANSVLVIGNQQTSPIIQGRDVTFTLYRPTATRVEVAGTFNNWQPLTMFRKKDDPSTWGVRYTLPPGQYAYKFIIDGEWQADPENFNALPDGSGNCNSSFVIR